MKLELFLTALVLAFLASCSLGSVKVGSADELSQALKEAKPGDTIIVTEGEYKDQTFVIDVSGTEKKPITIKAEKGGKVRLTGSSRLRIGADWIVVDGFFFTDGYLGPQDGGVIEFRRQVGDADQQIHGNHSVLRNTVVAYYNNPDRKIDYKWISLYGTYNTVENCELIGKRHSGVAMAVWREDDSAQHHMIRYNKFLYIEEDPDGNGAEALRIGTSDHSLSDSNTTVEYNYFEQCNGEIEIISNKSGGNVYRGNTFVDNAGMLTLRHGDGCLIEGNFFYGSGYYGTGGIRVIGEDHIIRGNYIENTMGDGGTFRSAICLTNAIENGPINGYYQVKNALVTGNVLVSNKRDFIIGGGASSKLTLPPVDSVIENNVVISDEDIDPFYYYSEPVNLTLRDNEVISSDQRDKIVKEMIEGSPLEASDTGASWSGHKDFASEPSFRKRNLFEEAYQQVVTLPWSKLVPFLEDKAIIVVGAGSPDAYIGTERYKYDIKDNSLRAFAEGDELYIPKSFIEFHLGSAGKTSRDDYISLSEIAENYGRHVQFHEKGYGVIISDQETFDMFAIPRMQDKVADLYRVIASNDDGNIAPNTLDGQLGTRWSADGDGQWIRFNLYGEETVSSASLAFYKGKERSTSFEIQASHDGENWETLFEGRSSGTSTRPEEFTFPAAKASYMRVVGHLNSANSWNSITEVQFYDPHGEAIMDYVKAKADVYEESTIEPVVEVNLPGTPYLPIDDAFVEIQSPDKVFGVDQDKLRIKAKLDASIVRISYVKFDLRDIPEINDAQFQISGKVSTNNPVNVRMEFDVYGIEEDNWEEETITWNNSPNHKPDSTEVVGLGDDVVHIGSFEMYGAGVVRTYVVDVSEFMKLQKEKDGIATLMLVDSKIQNTNSDPYSKERSNEAHRPYLFIQ